MIYNAPEFKIEGLTKTYNKTPSNSSFPMLIDFTFKDTVYSCQIDKSKKVHWIGNNPPEVFKSELNDFLSHFIF